MKILIVHAHPEPRSFTAALKNVAIEALRAAGHEVQLSDLYADGWKAAVDRDDFPGLEKQARLHVPLASKDAFQDATQTPDVAAEQAKLLWADAVILLFPLWWYAMPAILKGWVDRVYAYGFAYGVGEHSERRWGDRFGEGTLAGKRAMLVVTAGGWEEHYGARGVNGPIDDLLFPINHGILYYPGFTVLEPFVVYRADKVTPARFEETAAALRVRMATLFTAKPIPYRMQNGGDYAIPSMQLLPGHETPGASGFALHRKGERSSS